MLQAELHQARAAAATAVKRPPSAQPAVAVAAAAALRYERAAVAILARELASVDLQACTPHAHAHDMYVCTLRCTAWHGRARRGKAWHIMAQRGTVCPVL